MVVITICAPDIIYTSVAPFAGAFFGGGPWAYMPSLPCPESGPVHTTAVVTHYVHIYIELRYVLCSRPTGYVATYYVATH